MAPRLDVHAFALGDWMTNCYVVHPHGSKSMRGMPCWIIDAGFEPAPMVNYIKEHGLHPAHVVLTHAHLDHIGGLHAIRAAFPEIPILVHSAERDFLAEPSLNLSIALDEPIEAPPPTGTLEDGQKLELGSTTIEVIHTPGHSPGGISLYQAADGVVFVGDALFSGSVGRVDFPTSDPPALLASIRKRLLSLPDHTRVYSGHGPPTTIGQERQSNPYLQEGVRWG